MESYFKDLYSIVHGDKRHQETTTIKFRHESGLVNHTIDYIFFGQNDFKGSIDVKNYLDLSDVNRRFTQKDATDFLE